MNILDLNKILNIISKMDKKELEENISKAQSILNNSNFNNNNNNSNNNDDNLYRKWGNLWMKITLN